MTTHLSAWIARAAAAFRDHQRRDLFASRNPEEECVAYVLKALAEGGCPATAAVLESIDRRRAVTLP